MNLSPPPSNIKEFTWTWINWFQQLFTKVDKTKRSVQDYILIRDEKAASTQGGTFTSGAWQTRVLTTVVHDTGGDVSLSSNQITLQPGTYRFQAFAPAYLVQRHKTRLRNVTDNTDIAIGTSCFASSADDVQNLSHIEGRFTLTASKALELQHRCSTTRLTDGFGISSNFSVIEVYASIEFWKEIS